MSALLLIKNLFKMYKLSGYFAAFAFLITCSSCNNAKPKPVSNNISKTAVCVSGKKDSVINNPQKKYGNATVAEPCVKCFIEIVQTTPNYKAAVANAPSNMISYVLNWTKGTTKADTANNRSATNALKLDVVNKSIKGSVLATFIFDNSLSKLFTIHKGSKIELKIDKVDLQKIRDRCFWGVASGK
jgi:hypothetical protein